MRKDMRLSADIIVRLYSYVVNIKVAKIHHHRIGFNKWGGC